MRSQNGFFGPAEAGTTNGFPPGFRPFVVPPSGGEGVVEGSLPVHFQTLMECGFDTVFHGAPPTLPEAKALSRKRTPRLPPRYASEGGQARRYAQRRTIARERVPCWQPPSRQAQGTIRAEWCCLREQRFRSAFRLGKPSRSGCVLNRSMEWSGRALDRNRRRRRRFRVRPSGCPFSQPGNT